MIAGSAWAGQPDTHSADKQSAESFLDGIYAHYTGDPNKAMGVSLSNAREIRRYFAPSVADLMIADDAAAEKRDEVPALDADPFVDAQDWEIKSFDISVEHKGPDQATAIVRFVNAGTKFKLRLRLVRLADGWRVEDIVWNPGDGTLRGLYVKH